MSTVNAHFLYLFCKDNETRANGKYQDEKVLLMTAFHLSFFAHSDFNGFFFIRTHSNVFKRYLKHL